MRNGIFESGHAGGKNTKSGDAHSRGLRQTLLCMDEGAGRKLYT